MAQNFSLTRNAKLYVSTETAIGSMDATNTWRVNILDGFSFSQATETQEVTISEAGSQPDRGQQVFNTALNPVEWSFASYMQPRYDATNTASDAAERILWEGLAAGDDGTVNPIATTVDGDATTRGASGSGMAVDFDQSDRNQLITLTFIFDLNGVFYLLSGAVVNQAEIDFAIDGIGQITWSGFANSLARVTGADLTTIQGWTPATNYGSLSGNEYLQPPATSACIQNKLSTVTLQDNAHTTTTYTVALTGGSLTINNNITYLTPEALGVVNQPCAHFTGARQVSGNMTMYLKATGNQSAQLLEDLLSYTDEADPQDFNLVLSVGGTAAPYVEFTMAHTHLTIPTINIEDVVGVDVEFFALPFESGEFNLAATNELTVNYVPDTA